MTEGLQSRSRDHFSPRGRKNTTFLSGNIKFKLMKNIHQLTVKEVENEKQNNYSPIGAGTPRSKWSRKGKRLLWSSDSTNKAKSDEEKSVTKNTRLKSWQREEVRGWQKNSFGSPGGGSVDSAPQAANHVVGDWFPDMYSICWIHTTKLIILLDFDRDFTTCTQKYVLTFWQMRSVNDQKVR